MYPTNWRKEASRILTTLARRKGGVNGRKRDIINLEGGTCLNPYSYSVSVLLLLVGRKLVGGADRPPLGLVPKGRRIEGYEKVEGRIERRRSAIQEKAASFFRRGRSREEGKLILFGFVISGRGPQKGREKERKKEATLLMPGN